MVIKKNAQDDNQTFPTPPENPDDVLPPEDTRKPEKDSGNDRPPADLSEDPSEWPDDPSQEQLAKVYGEPQEGWKLNRDGSVTATDIPTYK